MAPNDDTHIIGQNKAVEGRDSCRNMDGATYTQLTFVLALDP